MGHDDSELAPNGAIALERLEAYSDPIQKLYRDVCWQGQALIEKKVKTFKRCLSRSAGGS